MCTPPQEEQSAFYAIDGRPMTRILRMGADTSPIRGGMIIANRLIRAYEPRGGDIITNTVHSKCIRLPTMIVEPGGYWIAQTYLAIIPPLQDWKTRGCGLFYNPDAPTGLSTYRPRRRDPMIAFGKIIQCALGYLGRIGICKNQRYPHSMPSMEGR